MTPLEPDNSDLRKLSEAPAGARFFDGKKRDLGWAASVSKRNRALGGLTVLDVTTSEPSLAGFLRTLDKARLLVQCTGSCAESYAFEWASGYVNGAEFRIQGKLER